jgi:hypothetical protein
MWIQGVGGVLRVKDDLVLCETHRYHKEIQHLGLLISRVHLISTHFIPADVLPLSFLVGDREAHTSQAVYFSRSFINVSVSVIFAIIGRSLGVGLSYVSESGVAA